MHQNTYKQSFLQKTQRFLEPIWTNKLITWYFVFYFLLQLSFGVIFVFLVRDTMNILELGDIEKFYNTLFFYGGVIIVNLSILTFFHTTWTYSYNRYRSSIEKKYFPKYVQLDTNFHERVGTGKTIAIMSKGIKAWGMMIDNVIIHSLRFISSIGVTLYLLIQLSSYLAYVLVFLLILANIIGLYLNSKVIYHRNKRIKLDNIWSKDVVKIIMAKMEILQSGKVYTEVSKLHDLHEGQIYYNKKMSFYLVPFFSLGILISGILLFIVFIYFGELYLKGDVEIGTVAALSGAILMMQTAFTETLDFLKNFTKDFAEVQNLWDFFDEAPSITGYDEGRDFIHKNGKIEIQNLSYAYDDNKRVFDDFSVKIPGNKITALVGPSGGGKSTLVKLISGYIRQDDGDIIIDDQNLRDVSLKSYYRDIGYLTQEPSVFDGSVRENLLYAVGEDVDGKKIEKVISLAHAEFIYDLPDGLDTEIGERGVKLSGGQKQRLAIAKIFLKDPKIIILDEPTSALDSISEKKITEAMHNLFKNRTVLVIAHRLQTVKHADDIIVIESGNIIERGTHNELVKNDSFYKEMLDLQSGF